MQQSPGMTWQQQLLSWFTPEIASVAPVTALIDPDGLYEDPALLAAIEHAGFSVLRFDDPLRFRLTYERDYREKWDRGEKTRPLVIHSTLPGDALPYDLTEQVALPDHIRTIKLADFFDMLDPNILLALDRDLLGPLWQVYQHKRPLHGGVNATADYLLAELFHLVPDTWQSDALLLAALLAHHYRGRILPDALVTRIESIVGARFPEWPLRELWGDRTTFYRFLGERWPHFLKREIARAKGAALETPPLSLSVPGPVDVPFGDTDVRVYLDTLLLEGQVPPVTNVDARTVPEEWMRLGVAPMTEADRVERFRRQTERLISELPAEQASHLHWLAFGQKLGEWLAVRWSLSLPEDVEVTAQEVHADAEERFAAWLNKRFSGLLSLPPVPAPLVVHQVAPHMAKGWGGTAQAKRAIIVVDGMSWAQWGVLRRGLGFGPQVSMEEGSIFAFVPSITQVSRQAIFAGDLPRSFQDSITTTGKEEARWRTFWEGQGALKTQVGYLLYGEGEANEAFFERLDAILSKPAMRVVGLVLGQVDKLTHGAAGVLSGGALQESVRAWGSSALLRKVVERLLAAGYQIWITADHGNVEAVGVGNPGTGSLTEERSERTLVFSHESIRNATAARFPNAIAWGDAGLPDQYYPLIAKGFEAFMSEGKNTLSHGGVSLEEMVVPFVRLEQVS